MYKNIFCDRKKELLYFWDDKQSEPFTFPLYELQYSYTQDPSGTFIGLDGTKLKKVKRYYEKDPSLYESDVPLDTRFLVQAYYDSDEISVGHNVLILDIETDSDGGFPNMETADKCITAISMYDKTTQTYHALILDKENKIKDIKRENTKIYGFSTEEDLLQKFLNLWQEFSPTIVSGWNSRGTISQTANIEGTGFDIPYLYTRIKNILGDDELRRLSPIGIVYKSKFRGEIHIAGVCTAFDYYPLYKRYSGVRLPSYQLGKIGKKEVGIDKIEYEGNLNDLYRNDINKYLEYNLNDVVIVVELDKKYNYIDQAREICHFCHVPYEYYDVSSRFLEGAVLTQLKKDNLIAHNKPEGGREEYEEHLKEDEEGFVGAYVKDPIPGKYDWVYDLDMQSLYPSVIQSLNISPETLVGEVQNWDPDAFASGQLERVKIGVNEYTIDEFKQLLERENIGVAANGAMYLQNKRGIIPFVIEKWLIDRKNTRKAAKEAHDKGDETTFNRLNRKQVALKILANSLYGVLGLPTWRWYNKTNATAVTLTGQSLIKTSAKMVNQYYTNITKEEKDYVLYIDTDSLFVSSLPLIDVLYPNIDKANDTIMAETTLKVTAEMQNHLNKMFDILAVRMFHINNHKFFIKQELISKSAMWLAKKRYMQWVINEGGRKIEQMDVKGIDVVRTSFPPVFSKFMEGLMISILHNKSEKEINGDILKFEEKLIEFGLEECAKSTSVRFVSRKGDKNYYPKNRRPFSIVSGSPAQVKAGVYYNDLIEKFGLQKVTEPIYDGQKIRYVYLKNNEYGVDCLAIKQDGKNPQQIMDFISKYVDVRKMYEQELKSKLSDFYKILKWDMPTQELKTAKEFFDFS